MTFLILFILAIVWILVLLPYGARFIREHSYKRNGGSIGVFQESLGVLSNLSQSGDPNSYGSTSIKLKYEYRQSNRELHQVKVRRRKNVIFTLFSFGFLFTLLGFLPVLRALWVFSLLSIIALFCYVALIRYAETLKIEQSTKLRQLPTNSTLQPSSIKIQKVISR